MGFQPIKGTTVLGFGHRARHGKDTAAQFLIEAYPHRVKRFAFADALYALCRIEHGMTRKDGPLLQRVGIEKRQTDPDVWVRAVYWAIVDSAPEIAVITDVRFPNETALVKSMGGLCVSVERRTSAGELHRATDRDPNHITETALTNYAWDRVLTNHEGCMDAFRGDVLALFDEVTRELVA